ncbi:hypothetical protein AB9C52_20585, partial [Burkholderia cenocepacia]|uniref:hypothetical protein n=1 Tax=Burkholderia cenocepacia TaxID=95486 RepID=UPI00350F4D46
PRTARAMAFRIEKTIGCRVRNGSIRVPDTRFSRPISKRFFETGGSAPFVDRTKYTDHLIQIAERIRYTKSERGKNIHHCGMYWGATPEFAVPWRAAIYPNPLIGIWNPRNSDAYSNTATVFQRTSLLHCNLKPVPAISILRKPPVFSG